MMRRIIFSVLMMFLLASSLQAQCFRDPIEPGTSGTGYAGKIRQKNLYYRYWSHKSDSVYINTLLIYSDTLKLSRRYDVCISLNDTSRTYFLVDTLTNTRTPITTVNGVKDFIMVREKCSYSLAQLSLKNSLVKIYVDGSDLITQYMELNAATGLSSHKKRYKLEHGKLQFYKDDVKNIPADQLTE